VNDSLILKTDWPARLDAMKSREEFQKAFDAADSVGKLQLLHELKMYTVARDFENRWNAEGGFKSVYSALSQPLILVP
jgi:hypothetical protein